MRDSRPVLVVTPSGSPGSVDANLAEDHVVLVMDEDAAMDVVGNRVLAGLIVVVDRRGPLRASRELVDTYLRSQPMGKVAILSAAPCATISTQFAILPARVDVFFAPWDLDGVKSFLRLKSLAGTASS